MRLTRRGWGVLALTVASFAMAIGYGARSLNVVMVPAAVALVGAALQVRRAARPQVTRHVPRNGFVGDSRTVELDVDAGRPVPGAVADETGGGLRASGARSETTLGEGALSYDVTLTERGVHRLGPAAVTITDVLGLVERTVEVDDTDRLLAYPPIREIPGDRLAVGGDPVAAREEFDTVREYDRGDSLRDVHWKSSAKRPDVDLLVREYRGSDDPEAVHLVAEAADGRADAMATAAASVAVALLDAGVPVGVDAPDGSVPPARGDDHRTAVLSLLARTGSGTVPPERRDPCDVVVAAESGDVAVRTDGRTVAFDDLAAATGPGARSLGRRPSRGVSP